MHMVWYSRDKCVCVFRGDFWQSTLQTFERDTLQAALPHDCSAQRFFIFSYFSFFFWHVSLRRTVD